MNPTETYTSSEGVQLNHDRQQGIVREFGATHGWIAPDCGHGPTGRRIFVHFRDIIGVRGFRKLQPGDRVEFGIGEGYHGLRAIQVKVIRSAASAA